jgi:hypothetical protein
MCVASDYAVGAVLG